MLLLCLTPVRLSDSAAAAALSATFNNHFPSYVYLYWLQTLIFVLVLIFSLLLFFFGRFHFGFGFLYNQIETLNRSTVCVCSILLFNRISVQTKQGSEEHRPNRIPNQQKCNQIKGEQNTKRKKMFRISSNEEANFDTIYGLPITQRQRRTHTHTQAHAQIFGITTSIPCSICLWMCFGNSFVKHYLDIYNTHSQYVPRTYRHSQRRYFLVFVRILLPNAMFLPSSYYFPLRPHTRTHLRNYLSDTPNARSIRN